MHRMMHVLYKSADKLWAWSIILHGYYIIYRYSESKSGGATVGNSATLG